jgi:hypothetical protein
MASAGIESIPLPRVPEVEALPVDAPLDFPAESRLQRLLKAELRFEATLERPC